MADCIFCKIVNREIPSTIELETKNIIVFKDIHPSTKYHVLIVPKVHLSNIETLKAKDKDIFFEMFTAAQKIIKKQKPKRYRLIVNGGEFLEVNHLHLHLQIGNLTKHAREQLLK